MVAALALILAACSGPSNAGSAAPAGQSPGTLAIGTVVDDIRVGEAFECGSANPECDVRLRLAREAAIQRHGLTPDAIGAARFYLTYLPPGAAYGSGSNAIVVFDVDDGSQVAVETSCFDGCFVVDPQPVTPATLPPAVDHGPLVDPGVEAPVDCDSTEHPTCNDAVAAAIASAREHGLITAETMATTHYYVTNLASNSSGAVDQTTYLVDVYVAGDRDVLSEAGVLVGCSSGSCQVVSYTDTSSPPEESPVPES